MMKPRIPSFCGYWNQKGFSKISHPKNGSITLIKLYFNQVGIIISDWIMPDIDDLEFHKSSKEDLIDGVPFLIVSAESERGRVA
jgi:hypothetical protein